MTVLDVAVVCETSGEVRDAFIAAGHNAISCDLLPTEAPGPHFRGDAFEFLASRRFDLMIAHPPCTFVSASGLHWNKRRPEREELTQEALDFVRRLIVAAERIPRFCLENPVGAISTQVWPMSQLIQPYEFGEDASKATCLWLKALEPLRPTGRRPGRIVRRADGSTVERWANQTDSGQNKLPPSQDRWKIRSRTYPAIARAMAEQWGGPPLQMEIAA